MSKLISQKDREFWLQYTKDITHLEKTSRVPPENIIIKVKSQYILPAEDFPTKIDLHGLTIQEAYLLTKDYLRLAQNKGIKKVLVITGKSKIKDNSIKKEFIRWLEEQPMANMIIGYENAGAGAYWVKIKQLKM